MMLQCLSSKLPPLIWHWLHRVISIILILNFIWLTDYQRQKERSVDYLCHAVHLIPYPSWSHFCIFREHVTLHGKGDLVDMTRVKALRFGDYTFSKVGLMSSYKPIKTRDICQMWSEKTRWLWWKGTERYNVVIWRWMKGDMNHGMNVGCLRGTQK
jgi:hypothetical protein